MWFWVILLAIGTFAIAAGAVGSVTGTLAQRSRRSVYDLAEATHFVADRLPGEVTARLSYDDVESVLGAHCDYLAEKGMASGRAVDDPGEELVLISEDDATAWVIGAMDRLGIEVSDEDVVSVLEVEQDYYRAIGMFGPEVSEQGP
ncbi:MAG: hypothetical protein M9942_04635 [Microthrixaceae bacterium]|nr:hypothetical protein [Microthrixaceae bacterium]